MTVFVAYAHTPDRSIPATIPVPDGEGLDVRWLARDSRSNDATGELIDLLHTVEPEVVVVGVRPRTSVGKFLLGSNAQRIILDSPPRSSR
jgi:nucleotide-binding universal stress UspA family protein